MRQILIRASQLAKFCEMNKYTGREEAIQLFWDTNAELAGEYGFQLEGAYDTKTEAALHSLSSESRLELCRELGVPDATPVPQIYERVRSSYLERGVRTETSAESKQVLETAPKLIEKTLEADVRMMRGTAREPAALDALESSVGNVHQRNSRCYTKVLFQHRGRDVLLVGRVDGLLEDGTPVETKERRNRLFSCVPVYERVQLESYMHLLCKQNAVHVQNFEESQVSTPVLHDPAFWNDCLERLARFLDEVVPDHS